MKKNKIAVFAGTFDPFTIGHYDMVKRSASFFDNIVVGVSGSSTGKKSVATLEERVAIAMTALQDIENAEVKAFDGLLTDFVASCNADIILRGLRTASDFEHEKLLASVYWDIMPEVEIFYLASPPNLAHISSTIVRELTSLGADFQYYVTHSSVELIKKVYSKHV
ncbi:MAG: pantetheine-phosphate adenylyltransferase [Firmicutes bacterium]|nr:pantetheine-phosphate adenylyltransferase [Bacillota bacterium]MCL2256045.1 pantetheine-phosphate adenylyltransferase [Bacillota bacterium]